MGRRKGHHVVSRGYQRLFAHGERLNLIDKASKTYRPVGTRDAFKRHHFSSYLRDGAWSDELEDEWCARENLSLPAARRLTAGTETKGDREVIKILAAIHYVRSYSYEKAVGDLLEEMRRRREPERIAAVDRVRAGFREEFSREPVDGEIEAIVRERLGEAIDGRSFIVEQMAHGFGKTFDILETFHVQLVWPSSRQLDFVFADTPLVHSHDDGRVGMLGGVALGDATQAYFPLSPRLLALFTAKPFADCPLADNQVVELNRRTWDVALRHLGAHPNTRVGRSLGRWDVTWLGPRER